MSRLENWSINMNIGKEGAYLTGNIYGDSRFKDETFVYTSTIQFLKVKENIAKTRNTTYELGTPDSKFVEWLTNRNQTIYDYDNIEDKEL